MNWYFLLEGNSTEPLVHVIIPNCCPETWFLGNARLMARQPTTPDLIRWRRFYDVGLLEPEEMGLPPDSRDITREQFHHRYLRAMFHERGLRYSKTLRCEVHEPHYLEALRSRCTESGHLASLAELLAIWDSLR